jgi:hypothetical protein
LDPELDGQNQSQYIYRNISNRISVNQSQNPQVSLKALVGRWLLIKGGLLQLIGKIGKYGFYLMLWNRSQRLLTNLNLHVIFVYDLVCLLRRIK